MASDIFAKLGDIKGESATTSTREKSRSSRGRGEFSRPHQAHGGGAVKGKRVLRFQFTHFIDKSSPFC